MSGGVLLDCEHEFKRYSLGYTTLGRVSWERCQGCGEEQRLLIDYRAYRKFFGETDKQDLKSDA